MITTSYIIGILLLTLVVLGGSGILGFHAFAASDRENAVDPNGHDVFVLGVGALENPGGFCTTEPCAIGETSPNMTLFNTAGIALGLTWGEWQKAIATSKMRCRKDGSTEINVKLERLIPGGVYSIFYRTFGPDSLNLL